MNRRRVAALLRELADELEEEDVPIEQPKRRSVPIPEPEVPVDEVTVARARRLLRRSGVAPR